jgi:hypothetical protein
VHQKKPLRPKRSDGFGGFAVAFQGHWRMAAARAAGRGDAT